MVVTNAESAHAASLEGGGTGDLIKDVGDLGGDLR